MKHIISYSGGLASFFEAKLSIEKHGKDNVELVFCDTKSEDKDLYRFLEDTEKYLDIPIKKLVDGRDIWECAFEDNFLYNSRVANCTVKLKMRMFREYIKKYDPKDIVVHIGFDYTEQHRFEKAKKHYKCKIESLIMTTWLDRYSMQNKLKEIGIKIPKLYRLGFAHNNCGGFCFKAGIGHFKQLYDMLPEVYEYHMKKEQDLIKQIGKDVSILKRVRNGNKINITLKDLKNEFMQNKQLSFMEEFDFGGCNCFVYE